MDGRANFYGKRLENGCGSYGEKHAAYDYGFLRLNTRRGGPDEYENRKHYSTDFQVMP